MVKCDFSGIELRIMARLTMDPTMIDLFKKDADLHKYMAAKVANKEMEEVTKDERTNAKIINFGFIYGMGAPTFQDYARNLYRIHMPIEEAEKSRRVFFQTYPEIAKWHREQAHRLQGNAVETYNFYNHQRGYYTRYVYVTRTLLDRKRLFPLAMGKVVAKLPETLNMPDQGTGADLMKISLARAYRELPPDYKLIAAVHDEIVLEVPEARAMDAGLWIKKIMEEEGCKLLAPVPVTAEVSVADSW
jgi:DNA polymerase-1